jgi:Plasmid pRiA4b ORF-3-like protein
MDKFKLTAAHERCLRDQTITDHQPGSVLHDFRALLDYLRPEGVEAAGKYNLLPIKLIGELDRRLSRPLHLESKMKRPQIRSHPYLQGLNLLLRASGLSRVEGAGDKSRLVLDPEMMVQWDRLNPTEQYFNLLEAWLRLGRPEMVGGEGSALSDMLMDCIRTWQSIPIDDRRFDLKHPQHIYVPGVGRDFYKLALMDLFGLVSVKHPPRPIMPWGPAGVERVPFGDAVFTLLFGSWFDNLGNRNVAEADEDEEEDHEADVPFLGVWQPLFQPYFPEWHHNLELPEPETREGTFIFRLSYGRDMWRRIAMPADGTLDDLASWILRSVNFDDDHLYEFNCRDRLGSELSIVHPEMDEGPWTDEVAIGDVPLEAGQTMEFHFDFGDDWRFDVKLERIEPPGAKIKAPAIQERHGESPEQYPDAEW